MLHYTHLPIIEAPRATLCQALDDLLERVSRHDRPVVGFEEVRSLLEASPLTTEEFAVATNRLANAQRYLRDGEPGAAQYELLLLHRSLER
jgi:hypothetical protein